jgi:hypothetical protein
MVPTGKVSHRDILKAVVRMKFLVLFKTGSEISINPDHTQHFLHYSYYN